MNLVTDATGATDATDLLAGKLEVKPEPRVAGQTAHAAGPTAFAEALRDAGAVLDGLAATVLAGAAMAGEGNGGEGLGGALAAGDAYRKPGDDVRVQARLAESAIAMLMRGPIVAATHRPTVPIESSDSSTGARVAHKSGGGLERGSLLASVDASRAFVAHTLTARIGSAPAAESAAQQGVAQQGVAALHDAIATHIERQLVAATPLRPTPGQSAPSTTASPLTSAALTPAGPPIASEALSAGASLDLLGARDEERMTSSARRTRSKGDEPEGDAMAAPLEGALQAAVAADAAPAATAGHALHDVAEAARTQAQKLIEDPALAVALHGQTARIRVDVTRDGVRDALHIVVRERDGVADVQLRGALPQNVDARAPELRLALGSEGLRLGQFDSAQQNASSGDERNPREERRDVVEARPAAPQCEPASETVDEAAHAAGIHVRV